MPTNNLNSDSSVTVPKQISGVNQQILALAAQQGSQRAEDARREKVQWNLGQIDSRAEQARRRMKELAETIAQRKMELSQAPLEAQRNIDYVTAEIGRFDVTNRQRFLAERGARLSKLANAYQQHYNKFGGALNQQALRFLQEHSKIDAPTLLPIMTGWEMARASAADRSAANLERADAMNERIAVLENQLLDNQKQMRELESANELADLRMQQAVAQREYDIYSEQARTLSEASLKADALATQAFNAADVGGYRSDSGGSSGTPLALAGMASLFNPSGASRVSPSSENDTDNILKRSFYGLYAAKGYTEVPDGLVDYLVSKAKSEFGPASNGMQSVLGNLGVTLDDVVKDESGLAALIKRVDDAYGLNVESEGSSPRMKDQSDWDNWQRRNGELPPFQSSEKFWPDTYGGATTYDELSDSQKAYLTQQELRRTQRMGFNRNAPVYEVNDGTLWRKDSASGNPVWETMGNISQEDYEKMMRTGQFSESLMNSLRPYVQQRFEKDLTDERALIQRAYELGLRAHKSNVGSGGPSPSVDELIESGQKSLSEEQRNRLDELRKGRRRLRGAQPARSAQPAQPAQSDDSDRNFIARAANGEWYRFVEGELPSNAIGQPTPEKHGPILRERKRPWPEGVPQPGGGSQPENVPVDSPPTGTGTLSFDDVANYATINGIEMIPEEGDVSPFSFDDIYQNAMQYGIEEIPT